MEGAPPKRRGLTKDHVFSKKKRNLKKVNLKQIERR
jgi:hypothetical protein